jgi:cell division protein FtsL
MNATVKSADAINQRQLISWHWHLPKLSHLSISEMKRFIIVGGLMLAVFVSGIAVIYVQNINRQLISQRQQLLTEQHQLINQRSELLQQKGVLTSQSAIDQTAQQKFNMRLPNAKDVVMVKS